MRSLALALALGLFACGSSKGGDDGTGLDGIDRIELSPDSATLNVALGATATQDYQVFGYHGDTKRDITSLCSLELADTAFGTFASSTLTVGARGGKTNVNALCDTLTGSGVLIVNLSGDVVGPGAPANAADLFNNATAGTDAARIPLIEYPLDKAVSPRNIPAVDVQYTTAGSDLFHVKLTSSYATINIYTTDAHAALSNTDWASVAQTAAGENLAFDVEALSQAAPQTKFAATMTIVTMSTDTIDESAIYWWSSNANGIFSQVFGKTDQPTMVKDDCTSCHSVSRSGTRIGYSRCVGNSCSATDQTVGFLKYDTASQSWVDTMNANAKAYPGSYTTFAPLGNPYPDDTKALALMNIRENVGTQAAQDWRGKFQLIDPDTATLVSSNLNDMATVGGTKPPLMPDWSPDGNHVVYAQGTGLGEYVDISNGRIAIMDYHYTAPDQHVFSTARVITPAPVTLASGVYDNFFFPSFSPDNNLIVFNATVGPWRNASANGRMMMTTPDGAYVTDLAALNGIATNGNTWPHWAPNNSNDYYWIVFASERDYGHTTTITTSQGTGCIANGVRQCKQIWLAAIAKNRIGAGMDPSSPPMWVPGQNPLVNNISPYWTKPVVIF